MSTSYLCRNRLRIRGRLRFCSNAQVSAPRLEAAQSFEFSALTRLAQVLLQNPVAGRAKSASGTPH